MNVRIFISEQKECYRLTKVYLFCMFSFFLFYYQDYYFDMTDAKYAYFAFVSGCFVSLGMMLCIGWIVCTKKQTFSLRALIHDFSITDWGFLSFLCAHCLTTVFSAYPMESLSGSSGRYLGLYATFLFTVLYFLISSTHRSDRSMMVFSISLCIAISLGILNFFGIDPLGFNERIAQYDIPRFLSTIGNISFFADAICLSLPFSITIYCLHEDKKQQRIALFCTLFGFLGIYICNADGGYIGIGMFLLIFLLYILHSFEGMKRFLRLLIYALGIGQLLHIITLLFPDAGRGFTSLSYLFTSSSVAYVLLCICMVVYVIYTTYPRFQNSRFRNIVRLWIVAILLGFFLFFLGCFLYFSVIDKTSDLKELDTYLRYSDAWGTGRGITWNRLLSIYFQDFSWLEKAFGYGLDCTRLALVDHIQEAGVAYYDNAHNEYLQYAITSGLFGLFSYCLLFFSIQYRLWKSRAYNLYGFALAGCLFAHGFQAIVGLTQPFSTPLLFILIAMAEASLRTSKIKQ